MTIIDWFFLRRDEDLLMSMDIQLVEALCGFQKPITTLDNRTIIITSHPGKRCFAFCYKSKHTVNVSCKFKGAETSCAGIKLVFPSLCSTNLETKKDFWIAVSSNFLFA